MKVSTTTFLFIIVLLIISPFFTIWSLNTLFPILDIPMNVETWGATVFLTSAVRGFTR